MLCVRKSLVCKDGTTLSVQASEYHYCHPRNNDGPWTAFETGTPLREEDYSVSGHVTEAEVWAYINAHGGLDLSALLNSLKLVF